MRPPVPALALLAALLAGAAAPMAAATLDPAIIENPRTAILDRGSSRRWEALFQPNSSWIPRQIAYLEQHQPEQAATLLVARLLYRGEPWKRRASDSINALRWQMDDREIRLAVLRALRSYRDPAVGDAICQFLVAESDAELVMSALVNLTLVDAPSGPVWALRLADPRLPTHLPGSANPSVRQQCLGFLLQTRGIDAAETRQALDWALLRVGGPERNHAIGLVPAGGANDLLTALVLKLAAEYRGNVIDSDGKFGLVLAINRLTGSAERELVMALMGLAAHGERAVAASAASALATRLAWEVPVAINDLAARAKQDPDPVVRQALLAFLMRLHPDAVAGATAPTSPWAALANHHQQLEEWEEERAKGGTKDGK
jgi:hypothetical protein